MASAGYSQTMRARSSGATSTSSWTDGYGAGLGWHEVPAAGGPAFCAQNSASDAVGRKIVWMAPRVFVAAAYSRSRGNSPSHRTARRCGLDPRAALCAGYLPDEVALSSREKGAMT